MARFRYPFPKKTLGDDVTAFGKVPIFWQFQFLPLSVSSLFSDKVVYQQFCFITQLRKGFRVTTHLSRITFWAHYKWSLSPKLYLEDQFLTLSWKTVCTHSYKHTHICEGANLKICCSIKCEFNILVKSNAKCFIAGPRVHIDSTFNPLLVHLDLVRCLLVQFEGSQMSMALLVFGEQAVPLLLWGNSGHQRARSPPICTV